MKRDQRFPVVMSESERQALDELAKDEALPAASVVRRLIIREAKERGLWPTNVSTQDRRAKNEEGHHT
jgi:hypothetical protein